MFPWKLSWGSNMRWALSRKGKDFLWFLGSGFQGGKPSKDSKAEAFLHIPWRNSRCWVEIPGQVWTGLELILKKKKKINILNNRCKLLCIYIHIFPQVPLNTLLNIRLWSFDLGVLYGRSLPVTFDSLQPHGL